MKLHQLKYTDNSRKDKKRLGRGTSSGHGKTSGKGHKGQNARSGGGVRPGFEGGQTPLFRRIPKIGFNNFSKKTYEIVNLEVLEALEATTITPKVLKQHKIIKNEKSLVKILGNGKITKTLIIQAHKVSKAAQSAIEAVNGIIKIIEVN